MTRDEALAILRTLQPDTHGRADGGDGLSPSKQPSEFAASAKAEVVRIVCRHYPAVQAIYLFGSRASGLAWPESDVDLAVLLPEEQTMADGDLLVSPCHAALEDALGCAVDLLDARLVSTVFQKEILAGQRLFCADRMAAEEFEMLTLSYYQQLNQERAEILAAFQRTGRAYAI